LRGENMNEILLVTVNADDTVDETGLHQFTCSAGAWPFFSASA
jgi:hypothetical protein